MTEWDYHCAVKGCVKDVVKILEDEMYCHEHLELWRLLEANVRAAFLDGRYIVIQEPQDGDA